ncbi:MAG: pectate lyase, partial [Planctomycetes bacterium]|nr:pectate lyase [Planctomycetota bacterium]
MRLSPAIACLLALCCGAACAETYYADPANGKAANPGSKAAPWGALEEVVSSGSLARLKGGDTLLLRGGKHG